LRLSEAYLRLSEEAIILWATMGIE
jgi:hypothetical protein